ncbi:MAG: DNA-binding protein WhiA [Oscillospiraceae bacterium]|nr:DNA-binding protein WhiA [Oscillospiraceae bacterium]
MSFSDQVRSCIRETINDHDRRFACLYGMLLYGRTVTRTEIVLKSESEIFDAVFPVLMKTVFGASVPLTIESRPRKDGGILHIYRITGEEAVTTIRHRFHIHEERRIDMRNLPTNSIGMFLGGVFLICGTMTDPSKDYHLEFAVPTENLGKDLCDLLYSVGVHPGCIQRRCGYSVYLKVSEEIGDLLTFMGAQKCTLGLIDVQIDKEMKNRINRQNNCDMANIDKVISASERQCADIRLIVEHGGMKELSDDLRELAELRLENPHLSLAELSEMLSKPIGRSGVNHRFRRLAAIAETYRRRDVCDE